jgi:hypothetical protein
VAAIIGLVGCAESYYYSPDNASVVREGAPAQVVKVPPELPQGQVVIASQGLRRLRLNDGRTVPALHVQLDVSNDGDDQPWTIDTREQLLDVPGVGRSRAIFVHSDVNTLPVITVARRERRSIDFYFPVPPQQAKESHLPSYDMLWQVNTSRRRVADRAHFQRLEVEPDPYYYGYPYYNAWGTNWWYDPFWPRVGYGYGLGFY